ncbi:hypothetical protein OAL14_03985 [Gammaproteobacteria bacterium]|nr:hypothetical protein [Gammaproteobacteria bacterium]
MNLATYLLWLVIAVLGCYVLYMVFKVSPLSGLFFLPLFFVGKSIGTKDDDDGRG